VIPFTYVSSFLFSQENTAQTITIFIHFVFAGIGPLVTVILRLIDSTKNVGDILTWVFKVIPTYCLTEAIIYDTSKTRFFLVRPELKKDSDYDVTLIGGNILVLMIHCSLWLFVLLLIEAGAFSWTSRILALLPKNRIIPKTDEQLSLDEDVIEEETRVETARDLKVRVNKFRKVYPGLTRNAVLAVERTSFGLDYGECFALLGINGAGKSTTFKALTCEIPPSAGQIHINGFNVQRQFDQVRKLIGYCP
jgi:ATP-binding cassette subfamily A (ABC1) protein 3